MDAASVSCDPYNSSKTLYSAAALKRGGSESSNISTDEPLKVDSISALQQVNTLTIFKYVSDYILNFQEMLIFEFVVGQIHRGHLVEVANEHLIVKIIERELIERMPPVLSHILFTLFHNHGFL